MSAQRLSAGRRAWLADRLSERDRLVLDWLARVRLATGQQLEQLCFDELGPASKPVVRGRVLGRLARWGLIEVVDHRVGGSSRGSTSPIYRLTAGGQLTASAKHARPTRPYTDRFTAHTLATTQLAVDLTAATAGADVVLEAFETEPTTWVPDGLGNYLKPDAYVCLQDPALRLHWWTEIDLGSESMPALEKKLRTYLDFVARGQRGPHDLIPRVLISVTSDERLRRVTVLLDRLPDPASELFVPTLAGRAAITMLAALRE